MRLRAITLASVTRGPFRVSFTDPESQPRPLAVLFGADGVGKTALLTGILHTRPGFAFPLQPKPAPAALDGERRPGFAVTEWELGDDDPGRPHPLLVASPNAIVSGEDESQTLLRRREQTHFDKRAQEQGGYCVVGFSGARWFSRQPIVLSAPERNVLRYDVRSVPAFEDATRSDMTRETKQILAHSEIASALSSGEGRTHTMRSALRHALGVALGPFAAQFRGVDPRTLEPTFEEHGREVLFDDLSRGAQHLVALIVGTLRAVAAAYPERDPLGAQGVAVVDDVEIALDPMAQRGLGTVLREALPRVQWIVATASPNVAAGCARGEVIALRRGDEATVEVQDDAVIH
ncbi:hypothetical protein BH09MYX1_BH09MYX1_04800 [soil metagenome]